MAEDGKMLGTQHHHGRIWAVRRHGQALAAAARNDSKERQGERRRGAVAAR